MRAGRLDKRLEVYEQLDKTQDGYGHYPPREKVAELWGQVEPLSGTELLRAQVTEGEITHRITMRYNTLVSANSLLRLKGTDRWLAPSAPPMNQRKRNEDVTFLAKEVPAVPATN